MSTRCYDIDLNDKTSNHRLLFSSAVFLYRRHIFEIYHLMSGYEFPWDMTRALELALYRTYCVPSITALLDKTGEFYKRTQKRYDDTALIVAEIAKWGYESERGRQHGSSPALSSAAAPGSTFQELCSKKLFRIRTSQQ